MHLFLVLVPSLCKCGELFQERRKNQLYKSQIIVADRSWSEGAVLLTYRTAVDLVREDEEEGVLVDRKK